MFDQDFSDLLSSGILFHIFLSAVECQHFEDDFRGMCSVCVRQFKQSMTFIAYSQYSIHSSELQQVWHTEMPPFCHLYVDFDVESIMGGCIQV